MLSSLYIFSSIQIYTQYDTVHLYISMNSYEYAYYNLLDSYIIFYYIENFFSKPFGYFRCFNVFYNLQPILEAPSLCTIIIMGLL